MIINEPNAMKEIHAIRVDNYERTKDLPPDERSRLRSEAVLPVVEEYGFRIVPRRGGLTGTLSSVVPIRTGKQIMNE